MTKMSDTPQDRSADGVPEVEQETPERRAARHALDRPLIEAFRAMIPNPHPMENCGPLRLRLAPGGSCPTCGTVPPIAPAGAPPGVGDVQASIADEVAALRAMIEQQGRLGRQPSQLDMLAACDRITALVPLRAVVTGFDLPLWLHVTCGGTATGHTVPKLTICRKCDTLTGEADWRALYTVAGR